MYMTDRISGVRTQGIDRRSSACACAAVPLLSLVHYLPLRKGMTHNTKRASDVNLFRGPETITYSGDARG